jgi:uncharacterized protein (DUF2237 family)
MLRDDGSDRGGQRRSPRNVLGEPLDICSIKPMTGFYRDGSCNTGLEDAGSHTICAVMTSAFLEYSKSRGNDLSTAIPAFDFPGLNPGDRWCASVPLAGRKRLRQVTPLVWSCAPLTRVLSRTARLPISNALQWTSRDSCLGRLQSCAPLNMICCPVCAARTTGNSLLSPWGSEQHVAA